MSLDVEKYHEIRSEYLNGNSQRGIAKKVGVARKTAKKYSDGAQVPWEKKTPERTSPVLTEDVINFIKQCLNGDETEGLKKQKHTAKRIYDRLV